MLMFGNIVLIIIHQCIINCVKNYSRKSYIDKPHCEMIAV